MTAGGAPLRAYIGSYTRGASEGIYLCRLDAATGALRLEAAARDVANPSYLALHPSRRFLYAVNELSEFRGAPGGAVSAFAIDPGSGALRLLGQQPSQGADPCHLAVDRSGRFLFVANYASGSVAVLPLRPDGSLGEATAVVQHRGSGAHPERQRGPHAHCVLPDASGRHLFVADLGADRVVAYRFDAERGTLAAAAAPGLQARAGAGPRHLALHPAGHLLYLVHELDSTVSTLALDTESGALRELQALSTLPPGYRGESLAAAVHLSPDGRYLYASNRGHDSLAVFAVDAATGRLSLRQHLGSGGSFPRDFAPAPGGRWLLAANQRSDALVSFRIDAGGQLAPAGQGASTGAPVCVLFV